MKKKTPHPAIVMRDILKLKKGKPKPIRISRIQGRGPQDKQMLFPNGSSILFMDGHAWLMLNTDKTVTAKIDPNDSLAMVTSLNKLASSL